MNSSALCHEIENCPGLYVDAFRGKFVARTKDPDCAFVLTHYHGDHYSGLPRENKYQGPAQIHCTPVTAELLRVVHQVPSQLVVEHEYGETWKFQILGRRDKEAQVTFYDAHHCPGAAIVLVELPDTGIFHLHTGDMRYHDKMKSYPRLRQAVQSRMLDLVYLDTTYGHPKHDFVPQEEAIDTIASHVETLIGTDDGKSSTLALLSCYSIGKEKVLWETSTRCNNLIHVTERKMTMLRCIARGAEQDASLQIIERCSLDPSKSDIHVIPMGLAGEMWPFFQPNYMSVLEYVEKLEKRYDAVVAFLPTGWADGSNWNKKNAVNKKRLNRKESAGSVDVEIRLVSYSEHSAFSELCTFVEYLRPRKVIPTVFSDDRARRKIEGRFRNLVDTTRAKRQFFKSMVASPSPRGEAGDGQFEDSSPSKSDCPTIVRTSHQNGKVVKKRNCGVEIDDSHVVTLVGMGFSAGSSRTSLERNGGRFDDALEQLLGHDHVSTPEASRAVNSPRTPSTSPTITHYFARNKS